MDLLPQRDWALNSAVESLRLFSDKNHFDKGLGIELLNTILLGNTHKGTVDLLTVPTLVQWKS
jgi:hypothetical protein